MKNDGTYFLTFGFQNGIIRKYYPTEIYSFVWEDIEFFTHRVILGVKDENPIYSQQFWQVTHKGSGMSLQIEGATKIDDAKKQAITSLEDFGIAKICEIINKAKEIIK